MTYYLIDQHLIETVPYSPFALTDVLAEYAGEQDQAFIHFWQLPDTMILGMKDTRVHDFPAGLASLQKNGYTPLIRNAGGLGVINDAGILNVSLIFPKHERLSINDAYEQMLSLMRKVFPELEIEAYEIAQSYCPGTYDLSVGGKKIAGTAQRRIKEGIAVMMYLSVHGDQQHRGEVVKAFYQASLQADFGKNGYPAVDPASMTTLSELLKHPLSTHEVKQRILQSFNEPVIPIEMTEWLEQQKQQPLFIKRLQDMKKRNQALKELI